MTDTYIPQQSHCNPLLFVWEPYFDNNRGQSSFSGCHPPLIAPAVMMVSVVSFAVNVLALFVLSVSGSHELNPPVIGSISPINPDGSSAAVGTGATKIPTVCLNMIVKNEAKVITRMLQSVLPMIDSYCICDTGSTDNTTALIETFMRQHSVPGMILHEPFRDFGHTRSFALQAAAEHMDADYLLLLDADMILQYPGGVDSTTDRDKNNSLIALKRRLADYDAWHMFQVTYLPFLTT